MPRTLLGLWKMSDLSGSTVPDTSGNGHNGSVIYGAPTATAAGLNMKTGAGSAFTLPASVYNAVVAGGGTILV